MANREKGEISREVGGKVYTLRPTFDALCELESMVDKPIDTILAQIRDGRVSGVRAVVWCLLQEYHSGEIKTLKDASRWIEKIGGMDTALVAINDVFGLNFDEAPAAQETTEDRPIDAQATTGAASSLKPAVTV